MTRITIYATSMLVGINDSILDDVDNIRFVLK